MARFTKKRGTPIGTASGFIRIVELLWQDGVTLVLASIRWQRRAKGRPPEAPVVSVGYLEETTSGNVGYCYFTCTVPLLVLRRAPVHDADMLLRWILRRPLRPAEPFFVSNRPPEPVYKLRILPAVPDDF